MQLTHELDEMVGIIILTRDKMTSSHVEPFDMGEKMAELVTESHEHLLKVVAVAFAKGMEVKTLYAVRKTIGQCRRRFPETRARYTWIIDIRVNHTAVRINPETYADTLFR